MGIQQRSRATQAIDNAVMDNALPESAALLCIGVPPDSSESDTQNWWPSGAGPQCGSGCHPAGGIQPFGGVGQLGGELYFICVDLDYPGLGRLVVAKSRDVSNRWFYDLPRILSGYIGLPLQILPLQRNGTALTPDPQLKTNSHSAASEFSLVVEEGSYPP